MRDGLLPQRDFFHAQGPLFLPSIMPAYILGGESLASARAGVALWSLIGLAGIVLAGWILCGRAGGICALAACTLSAAYLAISRSLLSEGPALGLSSAAVGCAAAYYARGQRTWLIAGALLLTWAVLVKALVIGSLAALAVFVLLGRVGTLRSRIYDAGMAAAVAAVVAAAVISIFRPQSVWAQAVGYHMMLKNAFPLSVPRNLELLIHSGGIELHVLIAAGLLGLAMLARSQPAAAGAAALWIMVTAGLLLTHSPLFARHLAALVPPLGLACAGIGLAVRRQVNVLAGVTLVVGVGATVAAAWPPLWATAQSMPRQPMLDEAAAVMAQLSSESDTVVTDHAAIAYAADRAVTPPLADLSRTRVQSGDLSDRTLQEAIRAWQPALILWWFGYVPEAYPRFQSDLTQFYTPVWAAEGGRNLVILGDGLNLPAAFLEGYRPAGRPTFGGAVQLQSVKHAGTGRAGANLDVRLLWNVDRQPPEDWTAVLSIRRNTGDEAGQTQARLGEGWTPTSRWRAQTTVGSYLAVPLGSRATGSFRVFLELHRADGSPVMATGGRVRNAMSAEISSVDIEPS
ncbi:MAG TPA: hypothetical protein VHX16_08415 [Chloroflexota bacterium]|nr:hypothetical protein [Chloroflexota bacterium]